MGSAVVSCYVFECCEGPKFNLPVFICLVYPVEPPSRFIFALFLTGCRPLPSIMHVKPT